METQPTTTFKEGDYVQYMHVSSSGSGTGLNFSTRRGQIRKITGTSAIIRRDGGKKQTVPISDLTHQGKPSPVNAVFNAFSGAGKKS